MKVDTTKLKKGTSELTPECRLLIDQITKCRSRSEILDFLSTVHVWIYGKCELYHWVEILDRFDKVLEEAARYVNGNEFMLHCDTTFSQEDIRLLLLVLNFTTLLIEHSFSRHLYNSVEHLTKLLSSQNMDVVQAVLNLLYMFSKRSNFIPRLSYEKKEMLLIKLFNIAERWGDPNYGLSLIDCCLKKPKLEFLYQLYIEYVDENGIQAFLEIPDMMDICLKTPPCEVIKTICKQISNPTEAIKMRIAHRVRLVSGFKDYKLRLQFVQARLQAVSVLIYSNALCENIERVLYTGFGEELCEIIDKEDVELVEIRAAVLRTLTSMLHFDRNPNVARPGSRLSKIIQYTGADRQGGILPLLVRDCISSLTGDSHSEKYPLVLATSLFSLLYHLASYEAGGQALVKSGMMQSLLRVISWPGVDLEHITFVTRAVRVIDLITNIDIAKFHQHNGLNIFIERLEKEVKKCRTLLANEKNFSNEESATESNDQQNELNQFDGQSEADADSLPTYGNRSSNQQLNDESESSNNSNTFCEMSSGSLNLEETQNNEPASQQESAKYPPNSYYARPVSERLSEMCPTVISQPKKIACVTQRAALLKSMLNFLKKSIQDHAHFNGMRNIMETSLPSSLRHIISNADFYGPSLFLLATDVVTVYVFNEPSLLSSLQDLGLTNLMLQSLLQKEVPATREVLGSLPNVFSALCLNERGLMEFMSYEPFDKLLKVLLSPDYLVAMRRRRSSDPLGDTATNLGTAMDDLMKHHPYLRTDATEAIVRLLNELVRLGTNSSFICWRANKEPNSTNNVNIANSGSNFHHEDMVNSNSVPENENNENTNDSSGEDDDEDDEMSTASQQQQRQSRSIAAQPITTTSLSNVPEREAIPLIDYILNVMKFIEAIFNNNSNGSNEHCREFVLHGGLNPLLQLLCLPNLPVDSPVSTTAQAVANVCKSILNLAHETKVIDIALQQLLEIVRKLKPLIQHCSLPGGSILLKEFLSCPKLEDGFSNAKYTPLLHCMSAVHGYVIMLVHLCRNASNEMRVVLLKRWGTNMENGLELLNDLVQLYISLVWESTILLNLCSEEQNPEQLWDEANSVATVGPAANKESMDQPCSSNEAEKKQDKNFSKPKVKTEEYLRYIKSLLAASSRLGRALAELFGTLVKLAVGTPPSRQRRNNEFVTSVASSKFPTPDAREIARVLSSILVNGFNHENMFTKPAPKLKLTFLICSVGFTGPMLFDDKRSAFHLMISQFCEEHGLKAFFDMFFWAISLNNSPSKFSFESCMELDNVLVDSDEDTHNFPEATGEFLDAWLQLLEKMVNPKAILDSPYSISSRISNTTPCTIKFEPLFYLIQVHQIALQSIRRIWKRKPIPNYGVSMTESIMSILKHLIKSHAMLRERYQSRINEIKMASQLVDRNSKTAPNSSNECNVNPDYLKILIDMGFIKTHVVEALINTRSLEQATEYLLNNPEASASANLAQSAERVLVPTDASGSTQKDSSNEMDIDTLSSGEASTSAEKITEKSNQEAAKSTICYDEVRLIPIEVFDKFCDETLDQIFQLMEYLPETINTGAELISVLYRRHDLPNKKLFVNNLVKNITNILENILQTVNINNFFVVDDNEELISGAVSTKLFIRLKVSTLLLDESYIDIRKELCDTFTKEKSLGSFLSLLNISEQLLYKQLLNGVKPITPRWLQTLVEFIDAIENVSIILQRKDNMRAVCSDNWKWYDSSTGKWNPYSESHNLLLKNAFNGGERSVVINNGRQRYNINFNCMTQVNEASGSHRTVLPSLKIMDAMGLMTAGSKIKISEFITRTLISRPDKNDYEFEDEKISISSLMNFNEETLEEDVSPTESINSKTDTHKDDGLTEVVETVLPVTANNSTKNRENKTESNQIKRVEKIVLNEEAVGLSKFDTTIIIACLVRMLEPNLLISYETKLTILKLCARLTRDYKNAKIFYKCGGLNILLNMYQTCGLMGFPSYAIVIIRHLFEAPPVLQESIERILAVRTSQMVPVGHRDVTFVLMQMSSAVARHPKIFLDAAKQVLKADHMMRPSFTNEDCRLLVKSQSTSNRKGLNAIPLNKLLDTESLKTAINVVKELLLAVVRPCFHYGGVSKDYPVDNSKEVPENESVMETQSQTSNINCPKKPSDKFEPCCCSWHIPSNGHMHQKPVLPRSTILKIIADAIRSYQSFVPQVIVEHVYTQEQSILIKRDQTFLAFALDNFLPIIRRNQDPEVSMMTRVIVASLSDCFSQPAIQTKVVEEIQEAIVRALAQPDSAEKQTRLQVLIGLLPTMIESPMLTNKIQIQRNNMYRVLLRQEIMSSLSKLAQYKDLSNDNSINTVYAILRPMEILLRLTVSPGALSSKRMLYGPGQQSNINRRFYPRLLSRSSGGVSNSLGSGEHVLRDIIRNVLSDRRHAFDFVFNGDSVFESGEDATVTSRNADDEQLESEDVSNIIENMQNSRPQLNFERLWDNLLQNEGLRLVNRNPNLSGSSGNNIESGDRQASNDDASGNDNVVSGGSDGASTSSETAPAAQENPTSLLGDVSTSDSESDSNVSTENEERNEEDDDNEEDPNEDVEDRSETDGDEETRQFIEVFDHIYEPESSETASNDADVDADDEGSEVGGNNSMRSVTVSNPDAGTETSSSGAHLPGEVEERIVDGSNINEPSNSAEPPSSSFNPSYNAILHNLTNETTPSSSFGSVRATQGTQWVTPRLTFVGGENPHVFNSIQIETQNSILNNDREIHVGIQPAQNSLSATNQTSPGQRRENSRRLVFLDQQYCAPMCSYSNPTEEGQIELFNQDALHWWFEEAKHLDLESQTDACLYVAHRIVPFLIKELKENFIKDLQTKKNDNATAMCSNNSSSSRRSAIPVLIQNPASQTVVNTERPIVPSNQVDVETPSNQEPEDTSPVLEERSETQQPNVQMWTEASRSAGDYYERLSNNFHETQRRLRFMNDDVNSIDTILNTELMAAESDQVQAPQREERDEPIPDVYVQNSTENNTNTPEIEGQSSSAEAVEEDGATQNAFENSSQQNTTPTVTEEANMPEISPEVRAALGDLEIPEGVDPSFLAALPSEMREEVIQEHLRMQRSRQRAQQNSNQVSHDAVLEVNPEFLAALPPNIQSEVLLQQRIEQQRQAAQSANPEDPVDTAAFFQNLPESLRQAILTDMEDSQIASLPPDLAAEAQFLRRDWESRNGARIGGGFRFPSSLQNLSDDSRWNSNSIWYDANGTPQTQHHQHTTILHHHQQQQGKPIALLLMEDDNNLLDPDSLSTLLLFLFIEDPKLNYTRIHRVIRNLCYHLPTREWIINALISIIKKTNEKQFTCTLRKCVKPHWLKLHVDAAFGYKSDIFIICKDSQGAASEEYHISINPQAAQMIVRNCLDMLFVLAKHFAKSFIPFNKERDQKTRNKQTDGSATANETIESIPLALTIVNSSSHNTESDVSSDELRSLFYRNQPGSVASRRSLSSTDEPMLHDEHPSTSKAAVKTQWKGNMATNKNKNTKIQYNTNSENFWDVILNIDRLTQTRLSNIQSFPLKCNPQWEWKSKNVDFLTFNDSPFAMLLEMLPYKVICRSPHLTDMLVKLLASLSVELPKEDEGSEPVANTESRAPNKFNNVNEQKKSEMKSENVENCLSDNVAQGSLKLKRRMYSKNFSQLQLVIEVLTHQCGTTEGLENISKLIVNLSQCSQASNAIFLQYLSAAVNGLAQEVRLLINSLLSEIQNYNAAENLNTTTKISTNNPCASSLVQQYTMQDRFTAENVVISAPSNIKPSCELQLPTMKKLLSPSSAQPYFLRTLKIFMQVRDLFESQNNEATAEKQTLSQIICLDDLWLTLSECLTALEQSKDEYAVLVLQQTVEAFFLIHASKAKKKAKADAAGYQNSTFVFENNFSINANRGSNDLQSQSGNRSTPSENGVPAAESTTEKSPLNDQLALDRQKFLDFAEKHRAVLNQILRQSPVHLADGPFAVLVDHTRILDFDVKRKYFQTELERIDEGVRREENTVGVRRVTVFEDSFRVLYRLGPEEWKNRFYIVFEDEEGQDAGGLLREWYVIISREIFNPMYALFCVSPGDRVTYMINPSSHANPNHLSYFKFVGRVIAKAIHDNKLLECYFTRSFYKHILGKQVKYTDMESQDYEFYKGLDYLMKNDISTLGYELTFSTEIQEFGVTQVRDLIPDGRNIPVTEENKFDYVNLVCQLKMSGSIRQQLDAFLEGFYDIIPKHLISIFNEQELELLISGLPDIDIEDLKANTEYHKYNSKSIQIQWFWRALRSFDQADRAKFLQFVTGTSKVPLQGFSSLEGMNGIQKFQIHRDDRSTDRLPCAHTCFNQLDLPMYKSYEKLRSCLLKAIHECSEGFGFA